MPVQVRPEYFDVGGRFLEGMAQANEQKRQNALLELQNKQYGLQERRVGAEEARLAQADAERQAQMQEAQKREGIGLRALAAAKGDRQSGVSLLGELGLPPELADDPDAPELYSAIAEQYGGFSMAKRGSIGQLYQVAGPGGQPIYQPAEQAIGQPAYRAPTSSGEGPAPSLRDIVDPKDPKRLITVDVRRYRAGGSLGDPGVIGVAGKEPAAAKEEETRGTGAQSVTDQVVNLRSLYNQLNRGGGIVNTDEMINVGNAIQSSGLGQWTGRVFGTENQSIRNSIKQARPLLLQAIRKATGMTAKQMDSNVELQLYLSAATDPTLDYQANMMALDNLDRLYGIGGQQPQASPQAAPGAVLRFDAQGNPIP